MRHTAYASLLGGSAGFTAGVHDTTASITAWYQPQALFGVGTTGGILDMQTTKTLFEGYFPGGTTSWGEFASTTALVDTTTSNSADNAAPPGERRILSGAKGDVILNFIPSSREVTTLGSLRFNCATWSAEWRDPRGLQAIIPLCPKGTRTQFPVPGGCPSRPQGDKLGVCDWLLYLRRPKSDSLATLRPGDTYLEVSVGESLDGDSTGSAMGEELTAQVVAGDGTPVSPVTSIGLEGPTQYGDPTVIPEVEPGNYWVVWEAEATDDGTTDIFARRVGADGSPVGDAFPVNQWTADSQFDPFTLIDQTGNVTVVWTSMGQDGDQGGIFSRKFQLSGNPQGDEFQVNVTSAGNQGAARGGADSTGNIVIAWRSGEGEIKARIYSVTGAPMTGELAVNSETRGREELVALEVDPAGSFRAHWESYSSADELLGRWVRGFDSIGNALGAETLETPQ